MAKAKARSTDPIFDAIDQFWATFRAQLSAWREIGRAHV